MTTKKTVYLPVSVPSGRFCWDVTTHTICEHFDNEGGDARCTIGFHLPYDCRDKQGNVIKPDGCLELKSIDFAQSERPSIACRQEDTWKLQNEN